MNFNGFKNLFTGVLLLILMDYGIYAEDICWSTFGDFQYKVLTDVGGTSFSNAISACERDNTTLTSVTSYEEDKFLQDFAMSQLGVPVWIGLYRKQDNLSWIDGSDLNYINKGYSRKRYDEGCVYMFQGWIEASCNDTELYFICKREVLEANTCTSTTEFASSEKPATTIGTDVSASTSERADNSTTKPTVTEANTLANDEEIPDGDQTKPVKTTTRSVTTKLTNYPTSPKPTIYFSLSSTTKTQPTSPGPSEKESTQALSTESSTESEKIDAIPYDEVTLSWESKFEKLLDEMTVKKKPVYKSKEAANSTAIGSVSILILVGIVFGVVLLDIGTIRHHVKMFQNNTKGLCNNCRKEQQRKRSDVFELKEIIDHQGANGGNATPLQPNDVFESISFKALSSAPEIDENNANDNRDTSKIADQLLNLFLKQKRKDLSTKKRSFERSSNGQKSYPMPWLPLKGQGFIQQPGTLGDVGRKRARERRTLLQKIFHRNHHNCFPWQQSINPHRQQIAAFQRKSRNCSLKQAAVTRFSLKSDEILKFPWQQIQPHKSSWKSVPKMPLEQLRKFKTVLLKLKTVLGQKPNLIQLLADTNKKRVNVLGKIMNHIKQKRDMYSFAKRCISGNMQLCCDQGFCGTRQENNVNIH